jgi:hypothetical protein
MVYLSKSFIAGVVKLNKLIAGVVVTGDKLSPLSLLPEIHHRLCRCYQR